MSIIIIFIENTELVLRECLRNRLAHNATQKNLVDSKTPHGGSCSTQILPVIIEWQAHVKCL